MFYYSFKNIFFFFFKDIYEFIIKQIVEHGEALITTEKETSSLFSDRDKLKVFFFLSFFYHLLFSIFLSFSFL